MHVQLEKFGRFFKIKPTPDKQVEYEYFRRIFKTFRIGFSSQKTDACSTCERLDNELKLEKDGAKRQALITQKRIHKHELRKKFF